MCTTESTNTYTQMGVEGDLEGGVQGGGGGIGGGGGGARR